MNKEVSYDELPEDIKRSWKKDRIQKVLTQLHNGNLEYVIVPVDPKRPVEWWSQRKNMPHIHPNANPEGWSWNGHYGVGRPPWTL